MLEILILGLVVLIVRNHSFKMDQLGAEARSHGRERA